MTLLDYFKLKGAKHHLRTYDLAECWFISLGGKNGDRFSKYVAVFPEQPDVLYVLKAGMQRYYIESHSNILININELGTKFKERYLKFIEELTANEITFKLNEVDE